MSHFQSPTAWIGITAHRRRDLLTILPLTVVAALGSLTWLDWRLASGWLVAALGFIGLNHRLGRWIDRLPSPNRRHENLMAGVTFVYALVYGLLPLAMIQAGGRASAVAGAAMLGAVALSSTAEFAISRRIGAASLLAVLGTGVAAVTRPTAGETLGETLVALIAALAFLAYVLVAALNRADTERRLLQALDAAQVSEAEAASANAAKSVFLATMSHEIRTPLNGVLGMIQVMQAHALSEPQRQRLDVVRKSGESLTAILNDVLDLSKIEAGRLEVEVAPFDLAELLEGCHRAFAELAAEKGLDLTLTLPAHLRGVYRGDALRLRQVIGNLLSNAVKFTAAGRIDIAIRRIDDRLEIDVADTGIGIAPDDVVRLFAKFSQVDASRTRRHGGSGLGLAISRELCGLMGGSIAVSSALDHGSTFTVSLPADRFQAQDSAQPDPVAAAPSDIPPSGLRVLAAEDNHVNQQVLCAILAQIGVEPRIVGDGAQALEAWRSAAWDLVLMDVHMPVLDGVAAVRAIRRQEALDGAPRTPVIALTANAMSHQVENLLAEGFDDHVAKPIEVVKLFAALDRAVRSRAEPLAAT